MFPRHYFGDSSRFDKIVAVPNRNGVLKQSHVFDAAIHIRTIALIEDMSQKDGIPTNITSKEKEFVNSIEFEAMIKCFAHNIVDNIKENFKSKRMLKGKQDKESKHDEGGGQDVNDKVISVYLATDTPGVRASFAKRISEITSNMLNEEISNSSPYRVEVDYFKQSLPPAHFFLWTMNNQVTMTDVSVTL